jgi:transcriptional regulator with XRE-family HTH domain
MVYYSVYLRNTRRYGMNDENENRYKEIGSRLKAIRKHIGVAIEGFSRDSGISRSYISDFERGARLPTSKYLYYLHKRFNVNLNYIFCIEEWKFLTETPTPSPDFGNYRENVDEMLYAMVRLPHVLFMMLSRFESLKLEDKALMELFRNKSNFNPAETVREATEEEE